jgi:hypothetical protein
VGVEVDDADALATAGDMAGDGADADGAVAAEDERRLTRLDGVADAPRGLADDLDDRAEVLCSSVRAVRPPAPDGSIAVVADGDAGAAQ